MNEVRDQITDLPRRISDRLAGAWPDLRDDPVYLDQLGEEAAKVVQPGDFRDFCGASAVGLFGATLGPCILRHRHDGPLHEDARHQQWTHSAVSALVHASNGMRDRIFDAIRDASCHHEGADYDPACPDCLADPVEDVFDDELAAKDAEIKRLRSTALDLVAKRDIEIERLWDQIHQRDAAIERVRALLEPAPDGAVFAVLRGGDGEEHWQAVVPRDDLIAALDPPEETPDV